MQNIDTYRVVSFSYDDFSDILQASVTTEESNSAETSSSFAIKLNFSHNKASIESTDPYAAEENFLESVTYTPKVLLAFTEAFQSVYDKLSHDQSPADVKMTTFDVQF